MSDVVKAVGIILGVGVLFAGCGVASYAFRTCNEAATVVHDETNPRTLLNKYSMLKTMHAELEKKQADIKVYKNRMSNMEADYNHVPRSQWPRDERQTYNQWSDEVAGVIASYNGLAAEYNSLMSQIQWRFTNVGDLPKGADVALPREYAPYSTQ